jgi:hypothetical protein
MAKSDELVTLGPFAKGVNNRLDDTALRADMLRDANNVQIDDTGRLSRRQGYEVAYTPAAECHSGFEWRGRHSVYRRRRPQAIRSRYRGRGGRCAPGLPLASRLPMSKSMAMSIIRTALSAARLPAPTTASGASKCRPAWRSWLRFAGAMPAGRYQVVVTHETATGEESGSGLPSTIELDGGQGILIADIGVPRSSEVLFINVYCSTANGDELYLVTRLPVGQGEFCLADTGLLWPAPDDALPDPIAGRPRTGGRQWPHLFGLWPGRVFIPNHWPMAYAGQPLIFLTFPADVTLMAGVADGLYIVADNTYFLSGGDPAQFQPRIVLPYGGAAGSLQRVPNTPEAWVWYSDRGIVTAGNSGQVKSLQEAQLSLDAAGSGATLFLEQDGQQQIISLSVPRDHRTSAAAQGFVDMEVRRKGS